MLGISHTRSGHEGKGEISQTQMDTDERERNDDSPFYEGGWGDLGLIQTVFVMRIFRT